MAMIHIDYETRSAADLKDLGVWAYAAHPTTSVLTAFIESDEGWRVFWTPVHCAGWTPPAGMEYRWGWEWLAQLFHVGNIFVAHNAEFERAMSEVNLHLPEVTWIDTMALADYLALPGGLDDLAKHLYGVGKDKAGYQLMMRMCKPSARYGDPNNHGFVPFTPESLTAYALYNARDVDLAKRFFDSHHRDWDDCEEPVYHWHQAVNKRGLRIDTDAAAGLRDICLQIAERAGATVTQATMHYAVNGTSMRLVGSDLTRVAHLTKWFNVIGAMHGGWSIDSCDEETLTTMLAQPLDVVPPVARAVAEARLSVSLASIKKVDAALNQISGDGRLRGQYRYCIAEGTPVLTQDGWLPIEVLDPALHRVWDGEAFVGFEELLDNGTKQCICIDGTWLTPDHQILDAALGWVEAGALGDSRYQPPGRYSGSGQLFLSRGLSASPTHATGSVDPSGMFGSAAPAGARTSSPREICATIAQISAQVAEPVSETGAITTSLPMMRCGETGVIGGSTWWTAATTPRTRATGTMAGAGSPCIRRGSRLSRRFSGTSRPSPAGTKCSSGGSTSIGLKMTPATCREISESSSTGSTTEIGVTASASKSPVRQSAPPRRIGGSSLGTDTTNSCASPRTRSCRVFDLYNAGPNHRFQAGRLLAHNCGAHTHRWTGRGMQPQNLPRPLPWLEEEALNKPQRPQAELVTLLLDACRSRDLGTFAQAHAAVEAYAKSKTDGKAVVGVNECLTSLIRPLIIPSEGCKLIGADFAQIEGRVAAWMSGDRAAIKAFEDNDAGRGPDVYCVMASAIFGRTITKKDKNERQAGKAAELLSTYGGGHKLLDSRHHDDFVRAGVTAEYVTNKWRELHRPTARYWRVLETAMRDAIAGRRGGSRFEAGPVVYERGRNGEVLLRFPSGRTMRYYEAQIESDDEYEGRTSIVYNSYKKGGGKNDRAGKIHLWGGHLLENADQSLSRDLLTSAALRIEAHGIRAVMHTHDELVFEVPDAQVAEAAEIVRREMATPPAWAPGLPIKGDPAVMIRYNKDA